MGWSECDDPIRGLNTWPSYFYCVRKIPFLGWSVLRNYIPYSWSVHSIRGICLCQNLLLLGVWPDSLISIYVYVLVGMLALFWYHAFPPCSLCQSHCGDARGFLKNMKFKWKSVRRGIGQPSFLKGYSGGIFPLCSHHKCKVSHLTYGNINKGGHLATTENQGLFYWHGWSWPIGMLWSYPNTGWPALLPFIVTHGPVGINQDGFPLSVFSSPSLYYWTWIIICEWIRIRCIIWL